MDDKISTLPDNVISEGILQRLPLRDAVRTSVLSRTWRYRWTMIPILKLNSEFFTSVFGWRTVYPCEYLNVVNSVLMQHAGSLNSFVLLIPALDFPKGAFDQSIHFVLRRGVRSLSVSDSGSIPLTLPSYLSPCLRLERLQLFDCMFNPPPGFAGFPNLKFLLCRSVKCSAKRLSAFISNCPKLEKVMFWKLNYLDESKLCIQAPNLRHLEVTDSKSFQLLDIQNVVKLYLYLEGIDGVSEDLPTKYGKVDFSCYLIKLQHLKLGGYLLKSLSIAGITRELSVGLHGLKTFTAYGIDIDDVDEFSCLLHFIRSSHHLHRLNVSLFRDNNVPADTDFGLEVRKHADCYFDNLTHIKVSYMIGSRTELRLIEFLLAHSPNLEKLSIKYHKDVEMRSELRMSRELMRFRRASPNAEIIYLEPRGDDGQVEDDEDYYSESDD